MINNNKFSQLGLFKEKENSIASLDISSLGIFQRCPLEYKYRFMPRDVSFDPQGTEILLGRILHLIASDYLSRPVKERNLDEYMEGYKDRLEGYFNSNKQEECKVAKGTFNKLTSGPLSKMTIRATEYSFKKRIERFLLKGRVDCIAKDERGDIIIDYKIDPLELDHHLDKCSRYLQLIFYYLGIKDSFLMKNAYLGYYFFNTGSIEMIEPSEKLVKEGWNKIVCLYNKINEICEYPALKSYYCSSCGVRNHKLCPLWA